MEKDYLSHMILEAPESTNYEHSERVADEFCKSFSKMFHASCCVLSIEKDEIDAIIEVAGNPIACEFVSYRQQDEYHDVEIRESQVKEKILAELQKVRLTALNVSIGWQLEVRDNQEGGKSGMKVRLPRQGALHQNLWANR